MTLLLITEKQLRETVAARLRDQLDYPELIPNAIEETASKVAVDLWHRLGAAGAMQVGVAVPIEGWATAHGNQHYVRHNETLCGHHLTEGPAFGALGEPERPGRCDICATALRRMASRGVHL